MKKEEYMSGLKKALEGFDEELVQEIVTDYEEHFRVGMERGRSEEELIEELGTAEDLVEEVNEVLGTRSHRVKQADADSAKAGQEDGTAEAVAGETGADHPRAESDIASETEDVPTETRTENGIQVWVGSTSEESTQAEREQASSENGRESHDQSWNFNWSNEDSLSDSVKDIMKKAMEQAGKAIDAAAKEMEKIDFDKIMKEAGDAMNKASQMMQESFQKQKEKWKEKGNEREDKDRENAAWSFSWDNSKEGRQQSSGQGGESCKKVVIQGEFADVTIEETDDAFPSASCTQYSYKNSMIYPFYSYQEGDIFYVGFRKNGENTERKSGFFHINNTMSAELTVRVPKGTECMELTVSSGDVEIERLSADQILIASSSGDMELYDICGKSCKIKSASGDMTLERMQSEELLLESSTGDMELHGIQGGRMQVEAVSGNLDMSQSSFNELRGRFTSGDVELENITATRCHIDTTSGNLSIYQGFFEEMTGKFVSGDVDMEHVEAKSIDLATGSGNINMQDVKAEMQSLRTRSGDVELDDCTGKKCKALVSSGNINVSAAYEQYQLSATSGDIELYSNCDADIEAEDSVGNTTIEIRNPQSLYKVSASSTCGDTNVSGQKNRGDGTVPTKKITVKSNTGDINVNFN